MGKEEQNQSSLMFTVLTKIVNLIVFPGRKISYAMTYAISATEEFTNISAANAAEYSMIKQILSLMIFAKMNQLFCYL